MQLRANNDDIFTAAFRIRRVCALAASCEFTSEALWRYMSERASDVYRDVFHLFLLLYRLLTAVY